MSKLYYNKENKGEYTNNEKLAKLKVERGEWKEYGETEDEIVMQGDNSGYVFKSEHIEPIDNIVSEKLSELKAIRDKKEVEPIYTPYGLFDYDDKARERINAAIISLDIKGDSISWTLADNTETKVTAEILREVVSLVASRSNDLHCRYRELSETIKNLAKEGKKEEIKLIEW